MNPLEIQNMKDEMAALRHFNQQLWQERQKVIEVVEELLKMLKDKNG
jgi:hypothetical protein